MWESDTEWQLLANLSHYVSVFMAMYPDMWLWKRNPHFIMYIQYIRQACILSSYRVNCYNTLYLVLWLGTSYVSESRPYMRPYLFI